MVKFQIGKFLSFEFESIPWVSIFRVRLRRIGRGRLSETVPTATGGGRARLAQRAGAGH